ncbi:hypothetical protein DL96DRAFT_1209672 [Flagelloscypha sp. PMI_526]|nr:hypothetical protein DL96DRAFT_1209672 [Flagelloscypha sp. PMI_526]
MMERLSSVLAALRAGKLPTQNQILAFFQWAKFTMMNKMEEQQESMSPRGRLLLKDAYNVLNSLIYFTEAKNADNIFQQTLHQCFSAISGVTNQSDPLAAQRPFFDLVRIFWTAASSDPMLSFTSVGSAVLGEASHILGQTKPSNGESIAASTYTSTKKFWQSRTWPKIRDALFALAERAQKDKAYHESLSAVFKLAEDWFFQVDPLSISIIPFAKQILARVANERSTNLFFGGLTLVLSAVKEDPKVRVFFEDAFAFGKRCLDEAGFVGSEEFTSSVETFKARWSSLPDEAPAWKTSWDKLTQAWDDVRTAIAKDPDCEMLRSTVTRLVDDVMTGVGSSQPGDSIFTRFSWLWTDLFSIYLPAILSMLRDIPIPRVEYRDWMTEFVLENLDLSTMLVNPAHVHLSNLANYDMHTDEAGHSKSTITFITRLKAQGISAEIDKVSFWYRDKTAAYGRPSDYSGRICNFDIPPEGLDLDMQFRLIPANPGTSTSPERERRKAFHIVDNVSVTLVEGEMMDFDIEDCNHTVLLSLFKPMFVTRLRQALERTLSYLLWAMFEAVDSAAWEIFTMTKEYLWRGMGLGPSVQAALAEEWDHLKQATEDHGEDKPGTTFTSSGIIIRLIDPPTKLPYAFALGSEPQILGPEKKGPGAAAAVNVGGATMNGTATATPAPLLAPPPMSPGSTFGSMLGSLSAYAMGSRATTPVNEAENKFEVPKKVQLTFRKAIEEKAEQEKRRKGWESEAFNM